jgi:hypothetical protein
LPKIKVSRGVEEERTWVYCDRSYSLKYRHGFIDSIT